MTELNTQPMTAEAALDRLETLYNQSVGNLRGAVRAFVETGARPDACLLYTSDAADE